MVSKTCPQLTVDNIINAPKHQLRAVLKALCTSDDKLHDRVSKYMVSIMNKDETTRSGTKRKAGDEDASAVEMKRAKKLNETHVCGVFGVGEC